MKTPRALLLLLATLAATIDLTISCSCSYEHPQVHACTADFVIVARILSSRPIKDPAFPSADYTGYRLKIQQILKTSASADEALKHKFITTPRQDSMCGANLQLKQLYLISGSVYGGRANVNLCNFVEPWNHLSLVQRKGFRKNYYENCNCTVRTCWAHGGDCHRPSATGCGWTTLGTTESKDCQLKHSVCAKQTGGFCGWNDNRYMNHCMTKTRGEVTVHHHNNEALDP